MFRRKTVKRKAHPDFIRETKSENSKPCVTSVMLRKNEQICSLNYRAIKHRIRQGMETSKKYTVYQFEPAPWLAKYALFIAKQRIKAELDFKRKVF